VKRRVLVIGLILVFVLGLAGTGFAAEPTVAKTAFSDVDADDDYAQAFALLKVMGIFSGFGDGTVRPADALTRAQFCKVVVEAMGMGDVADGLELMAPGFIDADSIPTWAWGYVNVAHALGVVKGRTDGTFDANANVLVQEAVTMVIRALGYEEFVSGGYPIGFLAKAKMLDIDEDMEYFQWATLPIQRSDMAYMIRNALWVYSPDEDTGKEDKTEGTRWIDEELVEGTVTDLGSIFIDGDEYDLASTVYLFGADTLEALVNTDVVAVEDADEEIAYIASPELDTIAGIFDSFEWGATEDDDDLLVLDDDTEIVFEDTTSWTLNGAAFDPETDDVPATEVEVTAFMEDDVASRIKLFTWDIEEAIVTDNDFDEDDEEYTFSFDDLVDGEVAATDTLVVDEDDADDVNVTGDAEDFGDIAADDIIRIATLGAEGLTDAGDIFQLEVKRETVSGTVADVVTHTTSDGTYTEITFDDDDDTSIDADPDTYDDTLPGVDWIVTLSLNFDGDAKHMVEYGEDVGDFVMITGFATYSDGTKKVTVDDQGTAKIYDLTDAATSPTSADVENVVKLTTDGAGDVTGVDDWAIDWILGDDEYTAEVYALGSDSVVLKVYSPNWFEDTDFHYLVADGPVVYDGTDYVGLAGLEVGDDVQMFFSDDDGPETIVYLNIDMDYEYPLTP